MEIKNESVLPLTMAEIVPVPEWLTYSNLAEVTFVHVLDAPPL